MYFYNMKSIGKKENIPITLQEILTLDRFKLIPLIKPETEAGKFLLEKDGRDLLSTYSREDVDIIYLAQDAKEKYEEFRREGIRKLKKVSPGIIHQSPCIVILEPDSDKGKVYQGFVEEDDRRAIQKTFLNLIDSLRTKNPNFKVPLLKQTRQIHELLEQDTYEFKEILLNQFLDKKL